eukprot:2627058-Rhodomonas_salina.1
MKSHPQPPRNTRTLHHPTFPSPTHAHSSAILSQCEIPRLGLTRRRMRLGRRGGGAARAGEARLLHREHFEHGQQVLLPPQKPLCPARRRRPHGLGGPLPRRCS